MKKTIAVLTAILSIICIFSGCSNGEESVEATIDEVTESTTEEETTESASEETTEATAQEIDVDLSSLSSTMVYSEVYNMMISPEDYIGKIIKMTGQYSIYTDSSTNKTYYSVIIADATACCQQGLEFVLADDEAPSGYEVGDEISVVGTFETYQEGELTYCHIKDAYIA